ncbi:MAG: circularly permuted type 2 ATP-grasp protein [Ferruginibacter sp.]
MPGQISVHELLQQYIPAYNSYNELSPGSQQIRPDWEAFFSSLKELGPQEIENRTTDILRLLKENGVAYNIYNDPSGENRPWELDPIPQLITAPEWDYINKGLVQRAELLDLLLKDIYGSQTLIKEGIIPQELIHMHPGFLRSCVNINLPAEQHLILYAADLARGTDGHLWVISDRTQAPSGYGYALENRFAMLSILPELFSKLRVSRLSPYFDFLQKALNKIAPHGNDEPKVIILTPGPDNETYFEHSYLAAYLGLTLVQGNDLMVKDNFVWLKTIEGLEKVDVILRRMDDIYCDPLELKSDSLLGVPGLLQVVRKGNVAIANPLGSSIVENAGMMPFLNAAAKHLLGQDLIIPSIATWWCGQPKEMQYVIDNLEHLVVRRIYRNYAGTRSAVDGASLSSAEKKELIKKIEASPYLYAGQEKVNFSSTPCWVNGNVQAGHSLIRNFLVRKDDSFVAMPGGLTRTSNKKNSFIISNQTGDFSKDTWVMASDEDYVQPAVFQLKSDDLLTNFPKGSLPSHTAENLFWAGRYTERIINNARLTRTVMQYLLQSSNSRSEDTAVTRDILLQGVTCCTYTYPGFIPDEEAEEEEGNTVPNPWAEFAEILYNENRAGSLGNNIGMFKRAAYSVRNFWSLDNWRVILQMDENWQAAKSSNHDHHSMINNIDTLNTSMFAFLGMVRESARREQEWMIMDLGRKFEQALSITTLLQNIFKQKTGEQTEHDLLESVLVATQSMITYRYTYRDHLQLPLLLELLMLDMNYPKSLAYLISKIKNYISQLPEINNGSMQNKQEKLITAAAAILEKVNAISLAKYNEATKEYELLNETLSKLLTLLSDASIVISKTYFKHTLSQKQLFAMSPA